MILHMLYTFHIYVKTFREWCGLVTSFYGKWFFQYFLFELHLVYNDLIKYYKSKCINYFLSHQKKKKNLLKGI